MIETFNGQLEIDRDRGVIYFHVADAKAAAKIGSVSMLRICRLPHPIPDDQMLDITTGYGVSWVNGRYQWVCPCGHINDKNVPPRYVYAKGDYMRWLDGAKAQLAGLFKLKEYYKHRAHQRALIRANNRERQGL